MGRVYRAHDTTLGRDVAVKMIAHELAARLDAKGTTRAQRLRCDEVIHPRVYINYRAVVLPDCLVWSVRSQR